MLRILLIIGVALAVVAVLFVGRLLWFASISAKLVAASRPFERNTGGTPRILVVGDSTGVGTGVRDPRGSVAGRFGTDFPDADIRNLSVNGWRVRDALAGFPATAPKRFDLVLLQIGANDIIRRTPHADFERDLGSLFDRAMSAGKNVVALHSGNVGLAPLFAWPLSSYYRAKTLEYRAVYRKVAEQKGVAYVDLFGEAEDDLFLSDIPRYYAPDLLHLTEDGYGEWYRAVRETMRSAGMRL